MVICPRRSLSDKDTSMSPTFDESYCDSREMMSALIEMRKNINFTYYQQA